MKHLQFEGVARSVALWHGDPNFESFMRHLITTVNPARFIETGTHMGWTSGWVAENFPALPVSTVEITDKFFQLASENLVDFPSVTLVKGDSRDFIKKICDEFRTNTEIPLFWLDAHWWPPVPLRDECRQVASLDRYVCVLDDFGFDNPYWEGDVFDDPGGRVTNNLAYVADIMDNRCLRPNYPSKTGYKGYGVFIKDVDYLPPTTMCEEVRE